MLKNPYPIVIAILLSGAMWLWVQDIAIPHQIVDSVVRGTPRGNLSDLYPRWLGARELLLRGRDPYGADVTREIETGYYGRPIDASRPNDPKDQQAFAYPVYVVFLLTPTVKLPFTIVQHGFLILLAIATAASVPLWMGAIGWSPGAETALLWMVLTLGCFPAVQGLKLQQLTLLVAVLLAGAMYAVVRRRFVLAGFLLALATIKPQLVALTVAWLFVWAIGNWRERRRLVWNFAWSMIALVGGGEWLLPGWLREFRAASAAYYQYTGGGKSILDVLLTPLWGRMVAALLVCVLIAFCWRVRRAEAGTREFQWSLALVMATTLAVIPMFAPYNQLMLLPALMVIVRSVRLLWANRATRFLTGAAGLAVAWPWLASAVLVSLLPFLPGPVVQRAWAVPLYTNFAIPLLVLGVLLFARREFLCGGAGNV